MYSQLVVSSTMRVSSPMPVVRDGENAASSGPVKPEVLLCLWTCRSRRGVGHNGTTVDCVACVVVWHRLEGSICASAIALELARSVTAHGWPISWAAGCRCQPRPGHLSVLECDKLLHAMHHSLKRAQLPFLNMLVQAHEQRRQCGYATNWLSRAGWQMLTR